MDDQDPVFTQDAQASYQSLRARNHFEILELCGCGSPVEAYNFLRDIIVQCDRRGITKQRDATAEQRITQLIKDKPEVAAHAILHLLDNLEVIDHGSRVDWAWLTTKGEMIVDGGPAVEADFDWSSRGRPNPNPSADTP